MVDHFRIDRFGNPAVQQTSQTLKVVDKGGYQRIRRRRLQQTANQLGVIAAKRLLNLMRSKAIALAKLKPADQLVGGAASGGDDHHIPRLRILLHDPRDAQVTFRIR